MANGNAPITTGAPEEKTYAEALAKDGPKKPSISSGPNSSAPADTGASEEKTYAAALAKDSPKKRSIGSGPKSSTSTDTGAYEEKTYAAALVKDTSEKPANSSGLNGSMRSQMRPRGEKTNAKSLAKDAPRKDALEKNAPEKDAPEKDAPEKSKNNSRPNGSMQIEMGHPEEKTYADALATDAPEKPTNDFGPNSNASTETRTPEEKTNVEALGNNTPEKLPNSSGPDGSTPIETGTPEEKTYAEALGSNIPEKLMNDSGPNGTETGASNEKTRVEALAKDVPDKLTNGSGPNGVPKNGHDLVNGDKEEDGQKGTEHDPARKEDTENEEQKACELDKRNGYHAGGIRFAPWNIPVKRRLQTLMVLLHSLGIAILLSFFFFLCAIPLTWPIMIPYLLHVLFSHVATDGKLRYRSERFRRLSVWKFFAGYFPAKLHKTHDLPPTRKYILGYHPHGIISHGAFAAFATDALGFSDKFPGITNSLLTLDSNFRIPFYRDYLLSMGLRSVSKESIGNLLTRGGLNNEGMGRAVTIVVGGARESLEAQPGTFHLILKERKGFIKLAIRTGADLVPVMAFGENDLYDQVSPKEHPGIRRLQMFVLRTLRFTLPFLHGRGIFNYDVGLMPYRRPLNIVVGRPIKVAQASAGNVDPAEVDRLHELYVAELEKIWNTHKDEFAEDRKEELQLFK